MDSSSTSESDTKPVGAGTAGAVPLLCNLHDSEAFHTSKFIKQHEIHIRVASHVSHKYVTPIKREDTVDLPTEPLSPSVYSTVSSAVQSTKMLWESIQTTEKWRWKNFFRTSCGKINITHLYALPLPVAILVSSCFQRPCYTDLQH